MKVELVEIYDIVNDKISEAEVCIRLCEVRENKILYQSQLDALRDLKRALIRKYSSGEKNEKI